MTQSEDILKVTSLTKAFGGLVAIFDLDFTISRGIIKAIIGPNGAGKTTLFNLISGVLPADTGDIIFNGRSISKLKSHQIAERGISRTFQTVELFKELTVLQNVMIGRHVRTRKGILSAGFKTPGSRKEERSILEKARYYLDFVGLSQKAGQEAGSLPLGQQKLLEIARALATEPELILLDEPAAGLNETETETAAQLFKAIRDEGITVVLVEHDMHLVMNVAEEVLVLDYGRKIADATPEVVRSDPAVINAYLGAEIEYA